MIRAAMGLGLVAVLTSGPAGARPTKRLEATTSRAEAVPFDRFVARLVEHGVGAKALPAAAQADPLASGVLVQVDARRYQVWDGATDAVGLPDRIAQALAAHVAAGGAPRVIIAADVRVPAGRVLHAVSAGRRAATEAGAHVALLVAGPEALGLWTVRAAPDTLVRAPLDALRLHVRLGAGGGYRATVNPLLAARWSIDAQAEARQPRGLERFFASFREHDPDRKVAVLEVPGDARFAQLADLVGVVRAHYPIVVLAPVGREVWQR